MIWDGKGGRPTPNQIVKVSGVTAALLFTRYCTSIWVSKSGSAGRVGVNCDEPEALSSII